MDMFTLKQIDELASIHNGAVKLAADELGVESFGMQVLDFPAGFADYPEHDHVAGRAGRGVRRPRRARPSSRSRASAPPPEPADAPRRPEREAEARAGRAGRADPRDRLRAAAAATSGRATSGWRRAHDRARNGRSALVSRHARAAEAERASRRGAASRSGRGVLPRGAAPPLHSHPQDETFYVLEGSVVVWVVEPEAIADGRWLETHARPCEPGAAVFAPSGDGAHLPRRVGHGADALPLDAGRDRGLRAGAVGAGRLAVAAAAAGRPARPAGEARRRRARASSGPPRTAASAP